MTALSPDQSLALSDLLLSVADDKLFLGHRNADWTGLAPILEEDIAFSALAQDDLAHAGALYEFVGVLSGRDANRLAYGRKPDEYRCCALVELPDEFDWSVAIARQFFCDHFEMLRLGRLARSVHTELAALARRILAEQRLNLGHADAWINRLGKGNVESRDRMQAALDRLAPLAPGLFEPAPGLGLLESSGLYPRGSGDMFAEWLGTMENLVREAGLTVTVEPWPSGQRGGRAGVHSDSFAGMLDELSEVYRVEPEARW